MIRDLTGEDTIPTGLEWDFNGIIFIEKKAGRAVWEQKATDQFRSGPMDFGLVDLGWEGLWST